MCTSTYARPLISALQSVLPCVIARQVPCIVERQGRGGQSAIAIAPRFPGVPRCTWAATARLLRDEYVRVQLRRPPGRRRALNAPLARLDTAGLGTTGAGVSLAVTATMGGSVTGPDALWTPATPGTQAARANRNNAIKGRKSKTHHLRLAYDLRLYGIRLPHAPPSRVGRSKCQWYRRQGNGE